MGPTAVSSTAMQQLPFDIQQIIAERTYTVTQAATHTVMDNVYGNTSASSPRKHAQTSTDSDIHS